MTATQQSELERAIERATEHGIIVLAQGRFKATNEKFYLTNSSSTDGVHVVKQHGNHLSCDCQASQHGKICQHRASVYMHLQVAAARRQAHAEAIEAALEQETAIAKPATGAAITTPKAATNATPKTSTQTPGRTAPLYRDSRPCSIFAPEPRGAVAISRETWL